MARYTGGGYALRDSAPPEIASALLTSDPLPYAAFITRHLMRPVGPRFGTEQAIVETEQALAGDRWFWADDNAKILEFLSLPPVWRAYPEAVEAAFGFLRALCAGPFIYRRVGQPRLDAVENDGARARFVHSLMDITCDLPNGIVRVGVRFHDGRTANNLTLTGNYVRFTHAGIVQTLDLEEAISDWKILHRGHALELSHCSELAFQHQGVHLRLGRLVQTYRFDGRSMVFRAEAALDLDPAVTVSDVVLTVGADDLSHGDLGICYDAVRIERPGKAPLRVAHAEPGQVVHEIPGAPYWSLARDGAMRGFAPAVHSVPREPKRLSALRVVSREGGLLHWVAAEHAFPGEHRGARLVAEEAKILTSGGFYDRVADYAVVVGAEVAIAPTQPLDLSLSYDYGVELTAFARRARVLATAGPLARPALEEALALHDQFLDAYEVNMLAAAQSDPRAIFSRPLSFVILGLVDVLAATGAPRYRAALRRAVDALLAFERPMVDIAGGPVSVFPMGVGEAPYLDCHAAALLALVRAAPALDDPRIAAAVDRALGAYGLATVVVDFGGPKKQDGLAVEAMDPEGRRTTTSGFWNYAVGLSLRGFAALRRSPDPAMGQVLARHADRIALLENVVRAQIARSVRPRGDALEIRTSVLSGETNSETQPWVAMGLVADSGDAV
jgi:hypothetical protein